jgi:hypothetical protein
MAAVTEPGRMTPGRGASPRRLAGSLTTRIGALALAAVLLTSVVGAAAAVILVQRATDRAAVTSLAALADSAQAVAALAPSPEAGQARAARALDGVRVQVAVVRVETVRGTVVTGDPLARRAAASPCRLLSPPTTAGSSSRPARRGPAASCWPNAVPMQPSSASRR